MSQIEAVLFDVDGTLIDSVDAHARAWQEVLAWHGFDLPFEKVRHQIGKGGEKLMPALLPAEVVERQGKAIEKERAELFKEKYLPEIRAFPGNRALFERIKADGLRIVLASSAKGDELENYKRIARDRGPDRGVDLIGRRRALEARPRHLPGRPEEARRHAARGGDRDW